MPTHPPIITSAFAAANDLEQKNIMPNKIAITVKQKTLNFLFELSKISFILIYLSSPYDTKLFYNSKTFYI